MKIEKVSVMNDKSNGGMTTDFKKTVSYLKKCVATTSTTHINLSTGCKFP